MPVPPMSSRLSLESLDLRVRALEADKKERDLNDRKTRDVQANEFSTVIESAVAQITDHRFSRVDNVNAQQLAYLQAMERERMLRHAAEAQVAEQKRREDLALATKEADRRFALKRWAAVTLLLGPIIGLIVAAIASHYSLTPPPTAPVTPHEEPHH